MVETSRKQRELERASRGWSDVLVLDTFLVVPGDREEWERTLAADQRQNTGHWKMPVVKQLALQVCIKAKAVSNPDLRSACGRTRMGKGSHSHSENIRRRRAAGSVTTWSRLHQDVCDLLFLASL